MPVSCQQFYLTSLHKWIPGKNVAGIMVFTGPEDMSSVPTLLESSVVGHGQTTSEISVEIEPGEQLYVLIVSSKHTGRQILRIYDN